MLEFQSLANSIFFLSIPVLAALYMLKLRRQNRKFPNIHFLKQIVSESKGSSLFKKLSANMLLFLEIMFLIFLCTALLEPFIPGRSFQKKKIAIIIDNSITMSSYEPGQAMSRFEIAVKKAVEFIENNSASEFTVISAAEYPALISGKLTASDAISAVKNKINVTHYKSEYSGAISIAEGFFEAGKKHEIHLFSDFTSRRNTNGGMAGKSPVIYHSAGSSEKNIGVTALDVSPENEAGSAGFNIFFTVKNYSPFEVSVPVNVFVDGDNMYSAVLTIAKKSSESKILKRYGNFPRDVRVEIRPEDFLTADNIMQAGFDDKKAFKILLLSDKPYFYKNALESIPGTAITISEKNVPKAIYRSRPADLAIIDDTYEITQYQNYQAGNFIFIKPESEIMGMKYNGEINDSSVKINSFPFEYMAGVDLSGLYVSKMPFIVSAGEFTEVVYSGRSAPLFLRALAGGRNYFVLAFDPVLSNLPLKVAFPVLLANIVNICRQNVSPVKCFKIGEEINLINTVNAFKNFRPADNIQNSLYLKNIQSGALIKLKNIDAAMLKNGDLNIPILNSSGDYSLVVSEKGVEKELFKFFVNYPANADCDITPGLFFRGGRNGNNNSLNGDNSGKNGYAVMEHENLSYAPFFIFTALLILMFDWIYQNHRLLWKKPGDKND